MNILHINTNDLRGGAAKVMDRLIVAQQKEGHHALALVGFKEHNNRNSHPFDIKKNKDMHVYGNKNGFVDYEYEGAYDLINNPLIQQTDIIHLHNIHGYYFNPYALSLLSHKKPVVWSLHDMQSITGHCSYSYTCDRWKFGCGDCGNLNEYPRVITDRTNLNLFEKEDIYLKSKLFIIPVVNWIQNMAQQGIMRSLPMQTITNGIDIDIYRPLNKKSLRRKYQLPENKILIGAVSNGGAYTQERKGGKFVEQVIQQLVDNNYPVLLVNVGGNDVGYVNEYTYNLGYITKEEEMAEVYNTFDIYMLPTLADTCPLVILEAMACAIPIVTFDTGGISELVIHNETGFVVPAGNYNQLYDSTVQLVKDEQLRDRLSVKAREACIELFDHHKVVDKYFHIYERVIKEHKAHSNETKLFNAEHVPAIVWNNERFQKAESQKSLPIHSYTENHQKLVIVSESVTNKPNYYSYDEAKDVTFSASDIVFVERAQYEINSEFHEIMLYKPMETEVLASAVNVLKANGKTFYKQAICFSQSLTTEVNSSFGGIYYRGDYFTKNVDNILKGNKIFCRSIENYSTELVTISIQNYIKSLVYGPIYIYGAGKHTIDLIDECSFLEPLIKGIIDKDFNKHGLLFMDKYIICAMNDIKSNESILISSASYEDEILEELFTNYKGSLLTIYNH